ncbi:Csu type fimbrial protein [Xanthomonas fragariae]|uniref:Csu type fimbrial protein n=1 Tax=Xanthomonas fragariae TaxID=48664 RepID=UPI0018FFC779|nr:spore coat U domain-containing protein [Xanthomonas fragariae]MDM7554026.1 spore coat U domain-containing protein [Xanthomonas fragariae]MDM7557149.1 spore coat U domain-containing protein [Xanthomonas fragariae]MDM7574842.1 spore coat U domain-containing protein [Xanthomonas fragariae]MDM7577968.1 spore coat U domain-containing protein [Xanthomonas fragariae]MDM7588165.1 spore coat U domain-containing protein [Xanthomonas fragariae]
MNMHPFWRLLLSVTIAALWLVPSQQARADTTCTVTLGTPLAFGNVAANGTTDAVATLSVSCSTAALSVLGYAQVSLCLDLGPGSASNGLYAPRRMLNSTNDSLDFQIYSEATRTQIWGTTGSTMPSPRTLTLSYAVPVITGGSQAASVALYGRIPANQILSVGNHTSSFGGADTVLRYSYNESIIGAPPLPANCTAGGSGTKTASNAFPFTASANVPARCNTYVTTDLDFGSIAGTIATAIDRTSTISLACTNRTAWNIGLDNGSNANGSVRRMRHATSSNYITYELYSNSGRSSRWGNTIGVDTLAGTGNGVTQTVTVYGRAPASQLPIAGAYNDTVTVFITY